MKIVGLLAKLGGYRFARARTPLLLAGVLVGCGTTQTDERTATERSSIERAEACRLLEDRDARALMSGALEIKLKELCFGAVASPDVAGSSAAPPAGKSLLEELGGNDILVNDPSLDTGGSTQSETSVAAFGNVVCAAWNDAGEGFGSNGFSGFGVSTDGGVSFVDRGPFPAGPAGETNRGDPSLAYSVRDGAFYYAALSTTGLGLWRSNDDCQTFSYVGSISASTGDDKELMAVDNTPTSPFYGRIYVGWTDFGQSNDRNLVISSDNGGMSWSAKAPMPGSGTAGQGMFPAIAPNGDVYFALLDRSGTTRTEWIYKSTDGGSSFVRAANIAANLKPPLDAASTSACGRDALKGEIRNLPSPQIAVSPEAAAPAGYVIHAVYPYDSDGTGPDASNVFYRRSLDGAVTWSAEVKLNDDATDADQFFPSLGLSPSGELGVSWYDRRLDPNNLSFDRYFVHSPDAGLTWGPNERLSDVSSPVAETLPNFDGLAACYHGDYDLVAATDEAFHVVWSDDRRTTGSGPNPDVYYDKVVLNLSKGRLTATPGASACNSTIQLALTDADLAGDGSHNVSATTATGDSEALLLSEIGATGSFTGSIAFASGVPTPGDGILQVANGTVATFRYDDANDGTGNPAIVTAAVIADCAGPAISNVATSSVSGTSAIVNFTASEPASATVSYGLDCSNMTGSVSSTAPSLAPTLTLSGLTKSTTYFYAVSATDAFGNASTDDNGGNCYEFTTKNSIFAEDFEAGLGGFVVESGLWHRTASCASLLSGHSVPGSLYYGQDGTCNFATNSRTLGAARSLPIGISATESEQATLAFNYLVEGEASTTYDRAWVELVVNGAAPVIVASNYGAGVALTRNLGAWSGALIDLAPHLPLGTSSIFELSFRFDSVDSVANTGAGFLVDDVEILAPTSSCDTDADCDDGSFCNGMELCLASICSAGTSVVCDDDVSCTSDFCDEPSDSCIHEPNDALCADDTVCNGIEICSATSGCVSGTPPNCDDGSVCTTDDCDALAGCTNTPLTCNDQNACTADACDPLTGCASTTITCSDGDACTADSCDSAAGCAFTPVTCSDSNVCTTDSCNSATGCVFTNNTDPCADDGNPCTSDVCNAGTCTHPANGTCGLGPFQESGGQVVMEAEHFHTNVARGSDSWSLASNGSASGGQVMQCGPDNGTNVNTGYVATSPELRFQVQFVTTGTYHVWMRGIGVNGDGDSCHAGIDGTGPASADRISSFSSTLGWSRSTMDGATATINVTTPGLHTISVWMREDGFVLDKILFTTNGGLTPTGGGPAESPRVTACTSAAQCDDGNPCTQDACNSGVCQGNPVANGSACPDDGNVCTNDVCSAGVCTHPDNGSCQGQQPCTSFCSNPTVFSASNYNSGNLGSQATCHQTTVSLAGGVCGNLVSPRQLRVNGQVMTCSGGNWGTLPAKVNGGYCIQTTSGDFPWAYFATW
jgi:hypothetical protein